MDENGFIQRLQAGISLEDSKAIAKALDILLTWLPIRPQIIRALGHATAMELQRKVIEELLLHHQATLGRARSPRAYARTMLANRYRDELRVAAREKLGGNSQLALEVAASVHSEPEADALSQLLREERFQAVLHVLQGLRLEERVALLLLYSPDRLTSQDWSAIEQRHAPACPQRPSSPLDRGSIAALLFPEEPAEQARARVTKLVQRVEAKLRQALARVPDFSEEEEMP